MKTPTFNKLHIMNKNSPPRRWISLAIVAMLFFSPAFLQGCDSLMGTNDPDSIIDMAPQAKFRHAELLDQATVRKGAGKNGSDDVGLIFAIEPQKVLDRFKILDRYKILDRFKILDRYEYSNLFNGFAIWADAAEADALIAEMVADPDIAWIEPDIYVGREEEAIATLPAAEVEVITAPFVRTGASNPVAPALSDDVSLFIIDTGVSTGDVNMAESIDFREGFNDVADYDGHGTHIAGIIAAQGNDFKGIAPGLDIRSLKVLNGDETSASDKVELAAVLAAVDHIAGLKMANPNQAMVVNLSLGAEIGTTEYNALDEAIAASVANGITYVISAGNSGTNAATFSPAHVAEAITVGAYDENDQFASFSNYGSLVDILAPGENIASLPSEAMTTSDDYVLMSGTSMATGFVSGAAALFLAQNPNASPAQVEQAIIESGNADITGAPTGTTNKTLSLDALQATQVPPFMRYAMLSGLGMKVEKTLNVQHAFNPMANANLFANGDLEMLSSNSQVSGFAYYTQALKPSASVGTMVFHPAFNPTGEQVYQHQPGVDVPSFNPSQFKQYATQTFSGDLKLSGHYQLGTRDNPAVWYVTNDILTSGNVTFSGYGVLIAKNNIKLEHSVNNDSQGETTLGFYAGSEIVFEGGNKQVAAQLFANSKVVIKSQTTLFGNITSRDMVEVLEPLNIKYLEASPVLTEIFWPSN